MKFDITNIDKVKLLQALYKNADPNIGVGLAEYAVKLSEGEDVSNLSAIECKIALLEFKKGGIGGYRIFDYYNGKPLKVVFDRYASGRIVISSNSYDERNGKYRFFGSITFAI